jgi:hypothetical protein
MTTNAKIRAFQKREVRSLTLACARLSRSELLFRELNTVAGSSVDFASVIKDFLLAEISGITHNDDLQLYLADLGKLTAARSKEFERYIWVHYALPVSLIPQMAFHDEEKISSYKNMESKAPPIIVVVDDETGELVLKDGSHRLAAAAARGEKEISSILGVSKSKLNSWLMHGDILSAHKLAVLSLGKAVLGVLAARIRKDGSVRSCGPSARQLAFALDSGHEWMALINPSGATLREAVALNKVLSLVLVQARSVVTAIQDDTIESKKGIEAISAILTKLKQDHEDAVSQWISILKKSSLETVVKTRAARARSLSLPPTGRP